MIKPVLYITILLFLFVTRTQAQQNLVPNGSFEEYNWCPNTIDGYYINACKYWTMPTLGTSDYFNTCSTELDSSSGTFLFSVPQNYQGYQDAKTGYAYAGLLYTQLNDTSLSYSEYIQVKLEKALELDHIYELRFFVHNPSVICSNSIGVMFTEQEVSVNNDFILPFAPQIQSDLTQFFCDTLKWYEIRHSFVASGGEQYITIGVFTPLYIIQTSDYNGNIISGPNQFGANSYLLVDDVSIIETNYELPNVFSPNGDGINDVYTFDNSKVNAKEFSILNRWGNVVYRSEFGFEWDGTLNGNICSEGVYFYILRAENDVIKNGFISLVR